MALKLEKSKNRKIYRLDFAQAQIALLLFRDLLRNIYFARLISISQISSLVEMTKKLKDDGAQYNRVVAK
jgi:hypothetical protein